MNMRIEALSRILFNNINIHKRTDNYDATDHCNRRGYYSR